MPFCLKEPIRTYVILLEKREDVNVQSPDQNFDRDTSEY